jgi:exodeoxyribonuclease V beta subunit
MSAQNFNPIQTSLSQGINLIEASAGTGKTYAIAMLVLRFIVEQNLNIEQLLVVTFTKAATEELKDRIRARLAEAKRILLMTGSALGTATPIDSNVLAWLDSLTLERELIKQRLETALLNIDQASIFTIHGFCQRVLTEHALESGQLFDVALTTEINTIKQYCTDDFWRREVYTRSLREAALLTAIYNTPDALLNSINSVPLFTHITPDYQDLTLVLNRINELILQANQQVNSCIATLTAHFQDEKFKDSYVDNFDKNAEILTQWLDGESFVLPSAEALNLLSYDGIKNGLNGQKFRANKQQTGDERKTAYLAELGLESTVFDELAQTITQIPIYFRRALVEDLRRSVESRLQQLNQMSFDDLISRLANALRNDLQPYKDNQASVLSCTLQQHFQVGLIDEFQDTDQQQWFIFSAVFNLPQQYLYLIGDPKQAIYKFRGADIFSYFTAQQQAQHHFTLGKNWRSHPQLVEAVNVLFQRKQAFLFDRLAFYPVAPARKSEDGFLQQGDTALAPLMLWQLDKNNSGTGDWTSGKAAVEIQTAVVNEIVNLLNQDFYIRKDLTGLKVEPKNIAVLVRTNNQARGYQAALKRAEVPAVINSIESVYGSEQAQELYQVLRAVANPSDGVLLKQALSLDWFDLDLSGFKNLTGLEATNNSRGWQFYRLINNEILLDDWAARFQLYHQHWQEQGLMAMMQHLLVEEQVFKTLSRFPLAERILTNVQHLLELLQQAIEQEQLSLYKILAYLAQAISDSENSSAEEHQLRLESDAQAVKIVTMHRSKGLEYDIVFCPLLWQTNEYFLQTATHIVCHHNGAMLTDLGSPDFETHKQQALNEQLAEDLRVFYVAVTRAKYRCYLAWANVRTQNHPNNSAMAYLLEFAEQDFTHQQAKLQAFALEQPDSFAYQLLAVPNQVRQFYQALQLSTLEFKYRLRKRYLVSDWQMSSYTALAALSVQYTPELPIDKAQEEDEKLKIDELPLALPRGSHTGNVIHNLLEFNHFTKLADPAYDISVQRDKTCARFGLIVEQPEIINQLLQTVVSTPLSLEDESFCLKNLNSWQCIKEMPFYLRVRSLNVSHINAILQDCPAFAPLSQKQMSGFLTGFIDLVCEYQGRYYVMDYKTNYLADYQPESLVAAMREHNYGLQYWLYSVVLDLYLQNRLQNYCYEEHFGGVRYLFVRGMRSDVVMSGVYVDRPDLERLRALAGVFGC